MKRNSRKLIAAAIFLILAVFYLSSKNARPTESLVAWGWQGDMPDRTCILQVITLPNQEMGPVHTMEDHCNYQIVDLQGRSRLVGEQKEPRAIVLYDITSTGDLVVEKTIPVEEASGWIGFLRPLFTDDGTIYFTGVLAGATDVMQGRLQLLRLDSRTGKISSFIAYEEGMIDFPLLSPNATYLVYSAFPGLKTWNDCLSHCGSYYHLVNLETNTVIDLASLVNHLAANPLFSHCNLRWSPNGRFIAFNIGCESESPGYIVIFDVEANAVASVIKPAAETLTSSVGLVGWLSNNELIYQQRLPVAGYNFPLSLYFVHSVSANLTQEWINIPQIDSEGLGLVVRDVSWTSGGKDLTGTIQGKLFVMNISSGESQVNYIASDTISERPLWSPSGNWIAYKSVPDYETFLANGYTVKIVNRTGDVILDTGVEDIQGSLDYIWLRP